MTRLFVPAADEVWRLQNRPGPESDLFMRSADVGHYAGVPNTRQGIYAFAPSGAFLASINSNDRAAVEGMIDRALAEWAKMPARDRYLSTDPAQAVGSVQRPEDSYPEGGLVLRVVSRDLPEAKPAGDWRKHAWNLDFAWFRKEEAETLVPERPAKGARLSWPRLLAERLVRFHLVDNVRGQTSAYPEGSVERAELTAEVEKIAAGRVTLRLRGETRAVQGNRGVEARLLGTAEWDSKAARFTAFELVAIGTRWGRTAYNFREEDEGRSPIGFLFSLAGEEPPDRVAPAFLHDYGW